MVPLVSVVILNWNGEIWLRRCLDSLSCQTYLNYEIIFVDNASVDDSVEYVRNNYPKVKIIESPTNLGFAGGNNLGIKYALGKYILLLNNDTWVKSNFIKDLVYEKEKQGKDVIAPIEVSYGSKAEAINIISLIDPLGHPVNKPLTSNKENNFYLSGVAILFSKSLYEETQGLDNNFFMYFEEIDWFWRLNLLNKNFGYASNICVHHYGSGSSRDKSKIKYNSFLWRNQNTLQMLLKNYSIHNLLWILPLYFLQNLFEILLFLILLKPKVSMSYLEGWWFNVRNIKKILAKRKQVQLNRIVDDSKIFKQMYLGSGKIYHMFHFLRSLSK